MIEGVAAGTVSQDEFGDWIRQRLVEPGEDALTANPPTAH